MYRIRIDDEYGIVSYKGSFTNKEVARKYALSWYLLYELSSFDLNLDKDKYTEALEKLYNGQSFKDAFNIKELKENNDYNIFISLMSNEDYSGYIFGADTSSEITISVIDDSEFEENLSLYCVEIDGDAYMIR